VGYRFPKKKRVFTTLFGVSHSSTSISAALGMAIASNLKGDFDKQHIAVIGDASIALGWLLRRQIMPRSLMQIYW
jgi:1-deoxy-D-xylulose-5-phosphate synthase